MLRRHREVSQAAMDYEAARLPRELAAAITRYMNHKTSADGTPAPVTRSELARRLGVTAGRISQILGGDENVTLHTVAAVCVALGAQLEVKLVDHDGRRDRADVPPTPSHNHGGGRRDRTPDRVLSGL